MNHLFEPVHLKHLTLKNRFARSSTNVKLVEEDGAPTTAQVELFRSLSAGGIGLIFSGHLYVSSPHGKDGPGQTGIYSDHLIPALTRMVHAGQENGCKVIAQLSHAGGKSRIGGTPVAPSSGDYLGDGVLSRALSLEKICRIVQDFTAAAVRAQKAGFDGIQVHCAHGYLLSEFIDPAWNHRQDRYGGSVARRFSLAEEIIVSIRQVCGADYPIFVKLNSDTVQDDIAYETDLAYMMQRFDTLSIEAVELSGTSMSPPGVPKSPYFLKRAKKMRILFKTPVILVGGFHTLYGMQDAVSAGIDMISFCRPLIAEPDLVYRLEKGQAEVACIRCNGCFADGIRCIRNPR